MAILHHHAFCPHSRYVRLLLGEYGYEPTLREVRPWERRQSFLILNPAGETPVLEVSGPLHPDGEAAGDARLTLAGAQVISEYLDELLGERRPEQRLMPAGLAARAETRRLTCWFNEKFFDEVTSYLCTEKIYKRFMASELGGGPPDMNGVRAARNNVRYHLRYIGFLLRNRPFLAGERLTTADLAAAAHLSCVDYLGDVPWSEDEAAAAWYARIKARPSFRTLLQDLVPGMAPAPGYARLEP
ncbi:glutathione S-transferase family protein [Camelimonas abortus]|uniref:Glutathione S-transferase family protein n=1 Tax=Camelimonas abortus TaxID=1017184 RepID=A0ABV7LB88_9HYPH